MAGPAGEIVAQNSEISSGNRKKNKKKQGNYRVFSKHCHFFNSVRSAGYKPAILAVILELNYAGTD